jgi:ectoine hydroxylase-related dioxygenase (phytanoyl-CoA dioxygenase family)
MSNQFFDINDKESISSFFKENGYVVVKVLSDEECKRSIDGINQMMKDRNDKFDIYDVSTYDHAPIKRGFPVLGKAPLFDRCLLENRCNKNIYDIFSYLYGDEDLLCNHDRVGLFRPTRGVLINDQVVDRDDWRSDYKYPSVHLDFNPTLYEKDKVRIDRSYLYSQSKEDFLNENNMYCRNMKGIESSTPDMQLQGVLNLLDNGEEDGGFRCIPGFHHRFDEWRKNVSSIYDHSYARYEFSSEIENDSKYLDVKKISCPASCMIVWDQRLAHGTQPNNSNHPRLIQYLRLFPSSYLTKETRDRRKEMLLSCIKKEDLEGLDTRVLGL